mmetsp:Transcript_2570/g.7700  ORF Transcript_2570/g.7700 Transcript_2570/m.7700 type:complete len:283 (-) Transcript_2570:1337-2185(-)
MAFVVSIVSGRKNSQSVCSRRTERVRASSAEFEAIKDVEVLNARSGESRKVGSLWDVAGGERAAVAFLTHFGDFSSWELGQKISEKLSILEQENVKVVCIGLGSVNNAKKYSSLLPLDPSLVYADECGSCHDALSFEKGFAPNAKVNPYLKLLPMLMGIGSPGTVQEVLRGYVGDRKAKQVFTSPNQFDVLGSGYQRPFELATLRLSNMTTILKNWRKLAPENEDLLTWQGGAFIFDGSEVLFKHADRGILTYVDFDKFLDAALTARDDPQKKMRVIEVNAS